MLKIIIPIKVIIETMPAYLIFFPDINHKNNVNSYNENSLKNKFAGKIFVMNNGINPCHDVGFSVDAIAAYKNAIPIPDLKKNETNFVLSFSIIGLLYFHTLKVLSDHDNSIFHVLQI